MAVVVDIVSNPCDTIYCMIVQPSVYSCLCAWKCDMVVKIAILLFTFSSSLPTSGTLLVVI
jgi:hypothetical protein